MAHNRFEVGGWAGEVTVRDLPAATGLAGVDVRLGPGSRDALAQGSRVGLRARTPSANGTDHSRQFTMFARAM
jgi:hypothetical protein